jgi:N-acetylmuramoyl-L-alanine amidase
VTIHATENRDAGADAFRHALALKNGALTSRMYPGGNRIGFLTWHFTVQDNCALQHLPVREQGEHADFNGPGNNFSIGIEMCEHPGNDMAWTVDRTARLAAYLAYSNGMPVSNVVPHYHWPRATTTPHHKACPHLLLDHDKPGASWRWFQERVRGHYARIVAGPLGGV